MRVSVRVSASWLVIGFALTCFALAGCTASGDDDSQPTGVSGAPAGGVGGSVPLGGMSGIPMGGTVAPAGGMGGSAGSAGSTMAGAGGSAGSAGSAMAGMGGMGGSAGSTMAGMGGMGGSAGSTAGSGGMTGTLGGPLKYTGTFTMGMMIPTKNMCPMVTGGGSGENKSPALEWTGGPAGTKSFAIVLFDTTYMMLHWAIWDIPPTVNMLAEGLPSGYELATPMGAHQAANMGTDKHAYYGPCSGTGSFIAAGTYEYRLYALNKDKLGLMESTEATAAQTAIEGAMLEMTKWAGKPPD